MFAPLPDLLVSRGYLKSDYVARTGGTDSFPLRYLINTVPIKACSILNDRIHYYTSLNRGEEFVEEPAGAPIAASEPTDTSFLNPTPNTMQAAIDNLLKEAVAEGVAPNVTAAVAKVCALRPAGDGGD